MRSFCLWGEKTLAALKQRSTFKNQMQYARCLGTIALIFGSVWLMVCSREELVNECRWLVDQSNPRLQPIIDRYLDEIEALDRNKDRQARLLALS